jgi:hypothetical protein
VNRRQFLRALGFTARALVVLPSSLPALLATHESAAQAIPIAGALVGNTFVTPYWINKKVLEMFAINLDFSMRVNREYDGAFGSTVRMRLPRRYA